MKSGGGVKESRGKGRYIIIHYVSVCNCRHFCSC